MLVVKHATFDPSTSTWSAPTAANTDVYVGGGMARMFDDASNALPRAGTTSMHTYLELQDAHGSNAFVVDSDSGEVVERTAYQAYGALDIDYRPAPWNYNREDYKQTGNWDNAEVGLVYMNQRYYAPQLGRFISPDPLTIHGFIDDPNPYEYANGNPIAYTDPLGLGPTCTGELFTGPTSSTQCTDTNPPPAPFQPSNISNGSFTGYQQPPPAPSPAWAAPAGVFGPQTPNAAQTPQGNPLGSPTPIGADHDYNSVAPGPWRTCDEDGCRFRPWLGILLPEQGVFENAWAVLRSLLGWGAAVGGGEHIVLGLAEHGLKEVAAQVGGRTLLADLSWKATLQAAIADPATRFTVSLAGVTGSSVYSQVMSAVQQGLGPNASPFNWEMAQLYQAGRLATVQFVGAGQTLVNPFQ